MQKLILSLLCATGIALSVYIIHLGAQKPPEQKIFFEPARSPYEHFIAGQGLIESVYKNSSLGPTSPQLVTQVFVKVADKVAKGDPLFQLDTRALQASKKTAQEDLRLASIEYENQKNQFSFYQKIKDRASVSQQMWRLNAR